MGLDLDIMAAMLLQDDGDGFEKPADGWRCRMIQAQLSDIRSSFKVYENAI
jgi:hypothetical protein